MFCKKGVLRKFTKFTGKHLCQSLFFNKVERQDYGGSYKTKFYFWKENENRFSGRNNEALATKKYLVNQTKKKLNQDMGTIPTFTCSKLTIDTLEQGVKYVQS